MNYIYLIISDEKINRFAALLAPVTYMYMFNPLV